jgi:hypothetical protein
MQQNVKRWHTSDPLANVRSVCQHLAMSLQKSLRLILLGVALLIWLLAQDLAFAMGRGGDGWDGPFFLSLVLIVSYPVALFITFLPTSQLLVSSM